MLGLACLSIERTPMIYLAIQRYTVECRSRTWSPRYGTGSDGCSARSSASRAFFCVSGRCALVTEPACHRAHGAPCGRARGRSLPQGLVDLECRHRRSRELAISSSADVGDELINRLLNVRFHERHDRAHDRIRRHAWMNPGAEPCRRPFLSVHSSVTRRNVM